MTTRQNTTFYDNCGESDDPQTLTPAQAEAAVLRAQGHTQQSIADQVHVDIRSVQRWCFQPEFIGAVRRLRSELWSTTTAELHQGASEAIQTLRKVMVDQSAAPMARAWAARSYIQLGARALEVDTLNHRVQEMEAHLARLLEERGVAPG